MEEKIIKLINYFILKSNESWDSITQLKLQKLLYYSQAWYLAINWKELFKEDFQAWVHWPVLRSVYDNFKDKKPWDWINYEVNKAEVISALSSNEITFLEDLCTEYLGCTWFELEQMTHNEDPWIIARNGTPVDERSENIINKSTILDYYKQHLSNG